MEPRYLQAFADIRRTIMSQAEYSGLSSLLERADDLQSRQTGIRLRDDAYMFLTLNLYWLGVRPWEEANPADPGFVSTHDEIILRDFVRLSTGAAELASNEELQSIPARLILQELSRIYEELGVTSLNIWGE